MLLLVPQQQHRTSKIKNQIPFSRCRSNTWNEIVADLHTVKYFALICMNYHNSTYLCISLMNLINNLLNNFHINTCESFQNTFWVPCVVLEYWTDHFGFSCECDTSYIVYRKFEHGFVQSTVCKYWSWSLTYFVYNNVWMDEYIIYIECKCKVKDLQVEYMNIHCFITDVTMCMYLFYR